MGVLWLASYPKSGNTWVRVFLSALIRPDAPPVLSALPVGHDLAVRSRLDDLLGLPSADLGPDELERLFPRACRQLAADAGDALSVVKAHVAQRRTPGGEWTFPPGAAAGVVYVVRNPLDVVASLAPFLGLRAERAADVLADPPFRLHDRAGGTMVPEHLGTWSEHVAGWLGGGHRVLCVCYEDLLADPVAGFDRVAAFVGLDADPGAIAAARAWAGFARLQSEEARGGFSERPRTATPFFREGQAGGWRRALDLGLPAELPFGPDLARDTRHLARER